MNALTRISEPETLNACLKKSYPFGLLNTGVPNRELFQIVLFDFTV